MKSLIIVCFFCCFISTHAQFNSNNNGHAEHFIGGIIIGGVTSYLVYKKTNNKWKSWAIGTGAATIIGLAKELIDPYIGRRRDVYDIGYTALGGAIGASIVFPLKKKKDKEVAYLF